VLLALQANGFNMTRTARGLGVSRATLYRMMRRNQIELAQQYMVRDIRCSRRRRREALAPPPVRRRGHLNLSSGGGGQAQAAHGAGPGQWIGLVPVKVLDKKLPTIIGHPFSPELNW